MVEHCLENKSMATPSARMTLEVQCYLNRLIDSVIGSVTDSTNVRIAYKLQDEYLWEKNSFLFLFLFFKKRPESMLDIGSNTESKN